MARKVICKLCGIRVYKPYSSQKYHKPCAKVSADASRAKFAHKPEVVLKRKKRYATPRHKKFQREYMRNYMSCPMIRKQFNRRQNMFVRRMITKKTYAEITCWAIKNKDKLASKGFAYVLDQYIKSLKKKRK